MARIKIENLPVIEDLTEAEAKAVKAGGVFAVVQPKTPLFSVSITVPNLVGPQPYANLTGISGKLAEGAETTVAGIRG